MYMSYCRFEGTRNELRSCMADVEAHISEEAEYEVSENEINHFRSMVYDFAGWLQDMALLDDNGCVNDKELDDVCAAMARAYSKSEDEE